MFAVVITGPPGAGKSEVASYLHDILGDEGLDAALIECDALERSYPALARERSVAHLRMLASSSSARVPGGASTQVGTRISSS